MSYAYQAQTFSAARRNLMLPNAHGEAHSVFHAFNECIHGLHNLNRDGLDDRARQWVADLEKLMDTTGIEDPDKYGPYRLKAEQLTNPQKVELSRTIDELANWFERASLKQSWEKQLTTEITE